MAMFNSYVKLPESVGWRYNGYNMMATEWLDNGYKMAI